LVAKEIEKPKIPMAKVDFIDYLSRPVTWSPFSGCSAEKN
jgi:hypothetical protein